MSRRELIPVACPVMEGNEKRYVLECLDTGWISSLGKFIPLFEEAFSSYCGSPYGIACNNGTSALHLALAGLGVGPGDEVIVPALTYIATANAVRYCGARPVFIDSEPRTMNLDTTRLEESITPRTKGIIAVHLYGHPADMDPVVRVARNRGLFVLEDAAEAHGATYRGRRTGSFGHAATFSFYGNKIITTGEGGMITTADEALAAKVRLLRGQGMDPARRYWFPSVGYNYRMTNIAAAIGLAQLERIEPMLQHRCRMAAAYREQLGALQDRLTLQVQEPWATHAYWSFPIVLRNGSSLDRDTLMQRLEQDGIDTRPVFYPLHHLPPYCEPKACYPVAETLARNGICLPMHGRLTLDDVSYVAERLAFWCNHTSHV